MAQDVGVAIMAPAAVGRVGVTIPTRDELVQPNIEAIAHALDPPDCRAREVACSAPFIRAPEERLDQRTIVEGPRVERPMVVRLGRALAHPGRCRRE